MNMEKRIREASVHYLELRGCEVWAKDYKGFIVFYDEPENRIVLASVGYEVGKFYEGKPISRKMFEDVMCKYMADVDEAIEAGLRYDMIEINVLADHRAIIRHVVNAPFEGEENR